MDAKLFRLDELEWTERDDGRRLSRLSDALSQSRATVWRYPPGTRGRRHLERVQEEVFVPISGWLTMLLGDPPERVEAGPGDAVVVPPGTGLQVRNEGDEELLFFAYGAPPVTGEAEFLPDLP